MRADALTGLKKIDRIETAVCCLMDGKHTAVF